MADKPIELFAALRTKSTVGASGRRKAADRLMIEFEAPEIYFSADEAAIAGILATRLTEMARQNMALGRMPFTGAPLPAADSATLERRQYREKQASRGGEITPRIKDPKSRADGQKNWRRRFTAPRLGAFTPGQGVPTGLFGIESGMLAKSLKAVASAAGTWQVFVAGPRGNLDRSGTSAMGRVRRIFEVTQQAMAQPQVQQALRQVAQGLLVKRGQKLLGEAFRTMSLLRGLAEETSDGG